MDISEYLRDMKKIVIHRAGSFDQLQVETHASITPKAGEVKVHVHAIGINYADVVVRWGLYKSAKQYVGWPITPGFEFSGTVDTIGEGITDFKPGDQVFGVTFFNGYSTEICVPQYQLFHLPHNMSLEEAAGFPAVFLTAYHALKQTIVIYPGSKTLVHSAAGGVGSALLQIARLMELETIGVVGSSHKVERAREMGATHVIDKSKQNLWEEVDKIYPEGADVIFDANGGESLKQGWKRLAKGGKMVTYGSHTILPKESGRINYLKLAHAWLTAARFNVLNLNTRSVVTFNLSFMFAHHHLLTEAMTDLIAWTEAGKISPLDITTYDFENVAQAHRDLQSGQTMGKLVLLTDH